VIHSSNLPATCDTVVFVDVIMALETAVQSQITLRAITSRGAYCAASTRTAVKSWLAAETAAGQFLQTCPATQLTNPHRMMISQIHAILQWKAETMEQMIVSFAAAARATLSVPDDSTLREPVMHALTLLDQLMELQVGVLGLSTAAPTDMRCAI